MLSRWIYILIGNDKTGKTTFQKKLLYHLCSVSKATKLNCNLQFEIQHPLAPKKLKTLTVINRSYQEKIRTYQDVDNYFINHFNPSDVCFLSSHAHSQQCLNDIKKMIQLGGTRKYNIGGVFFSNHVDNTIYEKISLLNWDERFLLNNPLNYESYENQLDQLAWEFSEMIIRRASLQ